ncbi:hypothetical protein LCGC14_0951140 [marine sediment metagenome]|uniref:Uncharacterized protein n=1 Tax=marine sediment metagenome TaxID=412755 RepID=A0A0F9NLX2_9ZZZZ
MRRIVINTAPERSFVAGIRTKIFIDRMDVNSVDGNVLIFAMYVPVSCNPIDIIYKLQFTADAMDELCQWWLEGDK